MPTQKFPAGLDIATVADPKTVPCRYHQKGTCSHGSDCPLRHDGPPGPKVQPKPKAKVKSMICAMPAEVDGTDKDGEEWVLDTGTGVDVAGGKVHGGLIAEAVNGPELITGGGIVKPSATTTVFLDELGEDDAIAAGLINPPRNAH